MNADKRHVVSTSFFGGWNGCVSYGGYELVLVSRTTTDQKKTNSHPEMTHCSTARTAMKEHPDQYELTQFYTVPFIMVHVLAA